MKMVLKTLILSCTKIITLMLLHKKKGIPKKKTYRKRNDTFGPLVPFGLCPNYSHDDNFFPHLYLINTCTYIQDMYLKILIQLIFSIMPSWSKKKNMLPSMWQYIRRRRMKRKVQRGGRNEREDGIKLKNKEINFLDGEREPERMTPSLDLS